MGVLYSIVGTLRLLCWVMKTKVRISPIHHISPLGQRLVIGILGVCLLFTLSNTFGSCFHPSSTHIPSTSDTHCPTLPTNDR